MNRASIGTGAPINNIRFTATMRHAECSASNQLVCTNT